MTFMRFPATRPVPAPAPSGHGPVRRSSPSGSRTVGKKSSRRPNAGKEETHEKKNNEATKKIKKKKLGKTVGSLYNAATCKYLATFIYKKKKNEGILVRRVLIKAIISKMPAKATYSSPSLSPSPSLSRSPAQAASLFDLEPP